MTASASPGFVISVESILTVAARRRGLILIATLVVLLVGLLYVFVAEREYRVALTVRPVYAIEESYNPGILAGLGGLGLDAGLTAKEKFNRYKAYLTSIDVSKLLEQDPLYIGLLFGDGWNQADGRWHKDAGLRLSVKRTLCKILRFPCSFELSTMRFAEELSSQVAFATNPENDMLTISIFARDPEAGARLLQDMHRHSDALVRQQELKTARAFLDSLEDSASALTIREVRSMLFEIMARQYQKIAVVESDVPYTADVVTGPWISPEPVRPAILFTLFVATLAGGFLGLALAVWLETRPRPVP